MRFLRLVATLLFLTVWLTAREHCTLEALGALPDGCAAECGDACELSDGCDTVENAVYKQALDCVHAAPPTLVLWLFAAPLVHEPERSTLVREPDGFSEPRARTGTWHFTERAAPPARAPAANV